MHRTLSLTAVAAAFALLAPAAAFAQAAADHGGAMGAPLFVADLPAGTISVRLARPSMTDAPAGVDVLGTWTTPDGKRGMGTAKTGEDGRAMFTAIPAGSTFQARADVDGEQLTSASFSVPSEGGTRLLMITGAQAAEASEPGAMGGGAMAKAGEPQAIAIRSGKVDGKDGIPAGTVELHVIGADGKAASGVKVSLGHVEHTANHVVFVDAVTDSSGVARFQKLETGPKTSYAAVFERDGLRVGSDAFSLDDKRGATGELRIPARTGDISVLHISSSSRMMVELREEGVAVLQNLVLENTSDRVFDPGPAGLLIPLPDGFTGGEKLPGGSEVEIKEGVGAVLHSPIPPTQAPVAATQVRIAYVLGTQQSRDFEIVQPMPIAMEGGLVLVPADYSVELSAPGMRGRPSQRDDNGNELRMFDLDSVSPGHALRLTVHGLPTHDQAGKWIAGILVALLVLAAIIALARTRASATVAPNAG